MKRYVFIFTAVLMAMISPCGNCLAAGQEAKVVIKMASIAPKGSNIANVVEEIGKQVWEKTNHEVALKIYWGGVQGDEKDVLRKMRLGQLHAGSFMGPTLGTIVPEVRVTEIPYVFWNSGEVDYVRSQLESSMTKQFADKGFVVLGWMDLGFIYTFSKVPITSLEVARKQKWWTMEGDPMGRAIFDALGISPISLSLSDVATALSTNLIDCAPSTPFGAVAFRWYTRFKYMSAVPSTSILGATLINKDIWDKISPDSQKIILDINRKEHEKLVSSMRQDNAKSLALLKKSGVRVVHSVERGSKDGDYVLAAAKKVRDGMVGKLYSKELLDRTLALLEEYRKNHPKYTPEAMIN
jgi:TRAP-type C4-dicarboxylate transport system substrate-binding protein